MRPVRCVPAALSLSVARTRHARIRHFVASGALQTVGHDVCPFRLSGLSPATEVADQTQERPAGHPILVLVRERVALVAITTAESTERLYWLIDDTVYKSTAVIQ
jgi:hypothetical protein